MAVKHETCSLPEGVTIDDANRGLEKGRCYVCGDWVETPKCSGKGRTDVVTEYGITVSNPFKVF